MNIQELTDKIKYDQFEYFNVHEWIAYQNKVKDYPTKLIIDYLPCFLSEHIFKAVLSKEDMNMIIERSKTNYYINVWIKVCDIKVLKETDESFKFLKHLVEERIKENIEILMNNSYKEE